MTRDEQLIRAALEMAVNAVKQRCDAYIRDLDLPVDEDGMVEIPVADEHIEEWDACVETICAIDPAEVLAKVDAALAQKGDRK